MGWYGYRSSRTAQLLCDGCLDGDARRDGCCACMLRITAVHPSWGLLLMPRHGLGVAAEPGWPPVPSARRAGTGTPCPASGTPSALRVSYTARCELASSVHVMIRGSRALHDAANISTVMPHPTSEAMTSACSHIQRHMRVLLGCEPSNAIRRRPQRQPKTPRSHEAHWELPGLDAVAIERLGRRLIRFG